MEKDRTVRSSAPPTSNFQDVVSIVAIDTPPRFFEPTPFFWLLLGWAVAGCLGIRWSVPVALAETGAGGFVITSDRLEMDETTRTAVFVGSVRAEEKNLRLSADKMTVDYHRKAHGSHKRLLGAQGGVDTIHAVGHVVLVQGKSRGVAGRMVYRVNARKLEMIGQAGNASILHGKDRLEGQRILLTLGADRRIVKVSVQGGQKKRVSARITPSGSDDERGKRVPATTLPRIPLR